MLDTSHRVREIAYEFWEEQGRPAGRDKENWFRQSGSSIASVFSRSAMRA